ncbi:VanZ family protein [Paeniglutamicibacter gangotriensis]|uniref:VanZ family protein n=1 Tax=Paeniglutamicibacter gangotriensis TaxID=254787 RepID=A0A5B0EIJ9_9MICC|nr:VanZ family protein [Paeniglutamicibacter gangotriensis]
MRLRRGPRSWALGVLLAYLAFVLVVALALKLGEMPLPEIVFRFLQETQERGYLTGVRFGHVEAAANVLFFVPLGVLLPLVLREHRFLLGWLAAVGLSVGIEAAQFFFLASRVGSIRDIVCNALGAAIGVLLCLVIVRWREVRTIRTANQVHKID